MVSVLKPGLVCLLTITLLFFHLSSQAQANYSGKKSNAYAGEISITGSVYDSALNTPVEYANIVLVRGTDSQIVNGTISDNRGKFVLQKINPGNYVLKISFIGYQTLRKKIHLAPGINSFNTEIIYITSSVASLREVTIVGEKPLVEYKLDKKVINVEKNINSSGGTAVDVLQNVPGVTVDIDGNVSIRGTSNVTILIDGRPSSLDGTKLTQIPASSIENIELITNPSAKYNPEGMGGILNIKLKKKRELGLNGVAMVNIGTSDQYSASLNLNYSIKKFNFFGSYDYRNNQRNGFGDVNRTTYVHDTPQYLVQHMDNNNNFVSNNVRFGLDYQANKYNTFTVSWLNNNSSHSGTEFSTNRSLNYLNLFTGYFETTNRESHGDKSNDFALNYKKTYSRKKQELTIDAIYSTSEGSPSDYTKTQYFHTDYTPANDTPGILNVTSDRKNQRLTIQGNFIYPLKGEDKIEAGFQSINRKNDNVYADYYFDYKDNQFAIDSNQSNHFVYTENINAIYGTLSKVYPKYSFQAGLRIEEAVTLADSRSMNKKFNNSYFSFFPTVHLTRKFEKSGQDLQLSYSRRINRPDVWSINPYVDRSNPLFLWYGNPALKPEYINAFEFGHTKNWKQMSLYSDIFYRQISHVIKRYAFLDSNNVLNMTSENLSSGVSYGFEFVFDTKITKWWKATLNFSYFRTIINGDNINTDLTNDNYSWTSSLNTGFMLPKGIGIQLTGNYNGPVVTPQGEMKPMFAMDFAGKKDFLKDKATVTVRLTDIFNTRKWASTSVGDGFYSDMVRKRQSRILFIGLAYKINGGLKSTSRKKPDNNGAQEENDMF